MFENENKQKHVYDEATGTWDMTPCEEVSELAERKIELMEKCNRRCWLVSSVGISVTRRRAFTSIATRPGCQPLSAHTQPATIKVTNTPADLEFKTIMRWLHIYAEWELSN